jgi:uncharacterized membrane protein YgaE (UPF0421/DUF939 family)
MDLELEYKLWKKRLDLFISEVELLINQNQHLSPIRQPNALNSVEVLALEEHQEELIKLKNRIQVQEQELKFYNKDFPITEQHDYYQVHRNLRKKNSQILYIHMDRVNDIIEAIGV